VRKVIFFSTLLLVVCLAAVVGNYSCRREPVGPPAPNAPEAPLFIAPPADSPQPPANSWFYPLIDGPSAYGLPLEIYIDPPEVPKEIQSPSPPITRK
jgi:hypothetical protein